MCSGQFKSNHEHKIKYDAYNYTNLLVGLNLSNTIRQTVKFSFSTSLRVLCIGQEILQRMSNTQTRCIGGQEVLQRMRQTDVLVGRKYYK